MKTPTVNFSYVEIPQEVLDKGYTKPVHVKGWRTSYRFGYRRTDPDGTHHIFSSKGSYTTKNPLLYTQRNTPPQYL